MTFFSLYIGKKGVKLMRVAVDGMGGDHSPSAVVEGCVQALEEFKDIEKSSKPGHAGLGLKNVAQTLDHYGGNMQVTSEEHEFTIHLYIPRT